MAKIAFIDLETTGLDPRKNGIHQISGQIFIDGELKEEFDIKARPLDTDEIEDSALAVGGVTREQVMSYQSARDAYNQLVGILCKYVNKYDKCDKYYFAGYNSAAFDTKFLRAFFEKMGDKYFGSFFFSNSLDVMTLATPYLMEQRCNMANFKQSTVAQALGIPIEEEALHNATYDIELCKRIYEKTINKW